MKHKVKTKRILYITTKKKESKMLYTIGLPGEFHLRCSQARHQLFPMCDERNTIHKDSKWYVHNLEWKNNIMLTRLAILHFTEIVNAFMHQHLHKEKIYSVYVPETNEGLHIKIEFDNVPCLAIYRYSDSQRLELFNKLECAILVRILNYYLNKYEIGQAYHEDIFEASYGIEPFTSETYLERI